MAGKFIVLSDIHLNLWAYGDAEDRLDDQIDAIDHTLQRAVEENVDAVLWTGDIFHTQGQVHTEVLRRLYGVLRTYQDELRDITIFLPGNHDMVYRNNSQAHALDFLSAFGHLPYLGGGTWGAFYLKNMPPIWAFPYTDVEEDLRRWLALFTNRDGDLLLMHQGVRGVEFQSKGFVLDEGLAADMIPPSVFHAFVGHCHSMRRVSSNMTVPGALQQHNFGDAGDPRGYLIAEYSDSGLTFQQVKVGSTVFVDVPYDQDLTKLKERVLHERADSPTDFLRIVDVPVSKVDEVRAWTKGLTTNDIKITTCSEAQVPLQVQQNEIGDIEALLTRFSRENNVDAEVLKVGHEILQGASGAVS